MVNLLLLDFSFEFINEFWDIKTQILANITQISQNTTQNIFSFSWKFQQTYRMQNNKKICLKKKKKKKVWPTLGCRNLAAASQDSSPHAIRCFRVEKLKHSAESKHVSNSQQEVFPLEPKDRKRCVILGRLPPRPWTPTPVPAPILFSQVVGILYMLVLPESLELKFRMKCSHKGMEASMMKRGNTDKEYCVGISKLLIVLSMMFPCCTENVWSWATQQSFIIIAVAKMRSRPIKVFVSSMSPALMVSSAIALSRTLQINNYYYFLSYLIVNLISGYEYIRTSWFKEI